MSHIFYSPVGPLRLTARAGRLLSIRFEGDNNPISQPSFEHQPQEPVLDLACKQLDEYFAGRRRKFDVPVAMQGTPFQLRVWSMLLRIPFGKTVSYKDLARVVGSDMASRAVGRANAANPLPIIVPCHRVIASDGTLAGFTGGVGIKRALLDQECAGAGLFAAAMA